jgi:HSP20 family protein
MDRLFEDFERDWGWPRSMFSIEPFWRREATWATAPAVDVAETDKAYEITAEVPGLAEKDLEVKLTSGALMIKGRSRRRRRKRRRTTISPNADMVHSSAASGGQRASTPTRSTRASRTGY